MKKSLLILTILGLLTCYSQSPSVTVPNFNLQFDPNFPSLGPTPNFLPQPYGLAAGGDWYKGGSWDDAGGVDFRTPFPLFQYPADKIGFDGRNAEAAQNCIFDANGEMSYFILDGTIFNKDGKMVESLNGEDLYAEYQNDPSYVDINHPNPSIGPYWIRYERGTTESEILVIPNPENCEQNFIAFTIENSRVRWVTFDASVWNPVTQSYGKVLNYNRTSAQTTEALPGIVFTLNAFNELPFDNGGQGSLGVGGFRMGVSALNPTNNERYMYVHDGATMFKFIVDANGITWDNKLVNNTFSDLASIYNRTFFISTYLGNSFGNGIYGDREVLEVYSDFNNNNKIAFTTRGYSKGAVGYIETDNLGNFISNSDYLIFTNAYAQGGRQSKISGIEFSNNGKYLYVNKLVSPNNPNPIGYIDVTSTTPTIIDLPLTNDDAFQYSQIEMGIDGKIYFINQNNLATLNNTNNPTAIAASPSSYWSPTAVSLPNTYYPNPTAYITLPDQIDGENWQDRFTSNCCELMEREYEFTASTGTQVWSPGNNPFNNTTGIVYIGNELKIPANSNIHINNMTFYFGPTAKVNIEIGGKLFLNATTLTSQECKGLMWEGVRVKGNPSASQSPSNHGYLSMYNNCVISNAYIGVSNCGAIASNIVGIPILDLNTTGGIIRVSNSTFLNNNYDLQARAYTPNSSIAFTNVEFITDALLLDGSNPKDHAKLDGVKSVRFNGCDFKNTTTGIYSLQNRGNGIYAHESKFTASYKCNTIQWIGQSCNNKDRGSFSNLYYGVYVNNLSSSLDVAVKYNDFDNCTQGVYFGMTDLAACVNNEFTNVGPTLPGGSSYGLYLNNCTGYAVQNNDISTALPGNSFGIIAANSNNNGVESNYNVIRNNTIHDLTHGIVGLFQNVGLNNGSPINGTGLEILCNDLENNSAHDIAWTLGGISIYQGDFNNPVNGPANNIFSSTTPANGDLTNYNLQQYPNNTYVYSTTYATYAYDGGYDVIPQAYNPLNTHLATLNSTTTYTNNGAYPVEVYDVVGKVKKGKFDSGKQLIAKSKKQSTNLIKKQNKALSFVDKYENHTFNSGQFTNKMLNKSPNLSDAVLISLLNMNRHFSYNKLFLIYAANAPFSTEVGDAIVSSDLPYFYKWLYTSFLEVQPNQISQYDLKQAKIASIGKKGAYKLNNALRDYLNDSTELGGRDTLRNYLETSSDVADKCRLTGVYISEANTTKAQDLIDSLRTEDPVKHKNFCDLSQVLLDVNSPFYGGDLKNDTSKVNTLTAVAQASENEKTSLRATSVLQNLDLVAYQEPIPTFPKNKMVMAPKPKRERLAAPSDNLISVFPNPTNGEISIVITEIEAEGATAQLFDNMGRLVADILISNALGSADLSGLDAGVYHIVLKIEDITILSKKVIKQ